MAGVNHREANHPRLWVKGGIKEGRDQTVSIVGFSFN